MRSSRTNHDQVLIHCSLGVSNTFSKHVRQRYERHFGRINGHLPVANHSLVLLDSPGIVDEDYIRAGHGTSFEEWIPLRDGAIEFVKGLATGLYAPSLLVKVNLITIHRNFRGTARARYPIQPHSASPCGIKKVWSITRTWDYSPRRWSWLAKDAR